MAGLVYNDEKIQQRFWDKVKKTNSCWFWIAGKIDKGYGRINLGKNKLCLAHRFSWILKNGKIPNGLFVCHKCDNPSCVNPSHLFLGTNKENIKDMYNKGRAPNTKGENNGRAILTWQNVKRIRSLINKYTLAEIAKKFGVSHGCVSHIKFGRNWRTT